MQRLRIRFSRGDELKFISHLDIIRLWQRALNRAVIPLAYSEGYNPRPRISLAAPLPVGVTSDAELMDIFCTTWVSPHFFEAAVSQQLPDGIALHQIYAIAPSSPSLQALVRYAEYRVKVEAEMETKAIEEKITSLLAMDTLPWQHRRDTGIHTYDLRALIDDLWLIDCYDSHCALGMRLRCDSRGSGRPEQVIAALDFISYPRTMHRNKLMLETG
jgi:radical SAM-linked protein